jgi:Spy/CpxP family protein refolding chaperone
MFGFLVGTLSLFGLIRVARWGRHGRGGWRGGGPRRWMMRRLFERLDTTPGQEKVVIEAVDSTQRAAWQAREELFRARGEYARALRGETFDGEAVNAAFEKQQAAVDEVKKALKQGMQSVHEALNPQQRAELADLSEYGPGRMYGGGWHGRHGRYGGHSPRGPIGQGPSTVSV